MLIKQQVVFQYKSTKNKYFFYILMVLFYLWLEVSFNYFVVSTASDLAVTTDELKFIELFGRFLSCIGCLVLLSRRIKPSGSAAKYCAKFFIMAALAIPTVYFGQKLLIDTLSSMASGDERMKAVQSDLVKGSFIVAGTPLNITQKINAALLPVLYYSNSTPFVLSDMHLTEITQQKQSKLLSKMYSQFSGLNSKLDEKYQQYVELNKSVDQLNVAYDEKINKAKAEVDTYWEKLKLTEDKAWETYRATIKEISNEKLDADLMNKLDSGFRSYRHGGSYSFFKKYEYFTKETVLKGTTPQDWQNGIYLPPKIWGGVDVAAAKRFYHKRYRALLREAKTGFFDEIKDRQNFITQDKVKSQIKEKLASIMTNNIDVEQINIDDKQGFEKSLLKSLYEAKETAILKGTGGVPLGLNKVGFVAYSIEQSPLSLPFTLSTKQSALLFSDYSQENFNAIVATPVTESSIDNIISALNSPPSSFENQSENSQIGTNHFKALLVIPFAISISLFLIIMLSFDLLLHINRYSQINFAKRTESRKIYNKPFYYAQMNPRVALLITMLATLCLVSYLHSEWPVKFAFEKVCSFVMAILEGIYYIGESTNDYISIKELFEPLIEYLEALDDLVFPK